MKKKKDLLIAKDIYKSYSQPQKSEILSGVSLILPEKTSIAIRGASGEGKTTLLHILGTLEKPDAGTLEIMGQKIENAKDANLIRNQEIGFIFQSYNLLEDFTTLENVLMPSTIGRKKISKKSPAYEKAFSLLKKVGLENRAHFPAKHLSGGEKQRAAIARSLCNGPKILLADEPSGNLDHKNSQKIHELLLRCVEEENVSLLVVTHEEELFSLCDHRFLLKDGKLS